MAKVTFKRGVTKDLKKEPLTDGLISVTTDDGRIHIDFINQNNELERKTLYSGKLTIGSHVYDGTSDVEVAQYTGQILD